jgi:hypothetical protein
MSIQNTDRKNIYSANGSTVYWPYTFSISTSDGSDLVLYVTNSDGATSTIARTLYTIELANKRIKYPKTGTALASGNTVTVARVSTLTQQISLRSQSFDPRDMETGLDKLTMIVQEQSETLSRALVGDITTTGTTYTMAAPIAGKVIGWSTTGELAMTNYDNPAVAEEQAIASAAEAAEYAEQAANSAIEAGTVVDYEGETEPSVYAALFKWHKPSVHTIYMRDYTNTSWISLIDTATGNILTNATTATTCIGNAETATLAATATLANAAKGDTRFQVSAGGTTTNLAANTNQVLLPFKFTLPAGASLKLKKIRYASFYTGIYIRIYAGPSNSWTTSSYEGEETPNIILVTNSSSVGALFLFSIVATNIATSTAPGSIGVGCWLDLSIE